jgi:hypothetical protein
VNTRLSTCHGLFFLLENHLTLCNKEAIMLAHTAEAQPISNMTTVTLITFCSLIYVSQGKLFSEVYSAPL